MANQISSSENERGDDHVVRAGWATRAGWVTRAICRPPVEHARFCRPGGLVRQVSLQRIGGRGYQYAAPLEVLTGKGVA